MENDEIPMPESPVRLQMLLTQALINADKKERLERRMAAMLKGKPAEPGSLAGLPGKAAPEPQPGPRPVPQAATQKFSIYIVMLDVYGTLSVEEVLRELRKLDEVIDVIKYSRSVYLVSAHGLDPVVIREHMKAMCESESDIFVVKPTAGYAASIRGSRNNVIEWIQENMRKLLEAGS